MLAGESGNDRAVLRVLLEALCPQAQGRIVYVNDAVPLRDATGANLAQRVKHFAKLVRARAARERAEVACVFIHEDFDAVDSPSHDVAHKRVQQALDQEFGHAHYVLAAWEIEAWLLLFPQGLTTFATSWKVPASYRGIDTGKIHDPKRVLRHEVSKAGPRYRESDGPAIVERAVAVGLHTAPAGSNRSYARFRADALACCGRLGARSTSSARSRTPG